MAQLLLQFLKPGMHFSGIDRRLDQQFLSLGERRTQFRVLGRER
ncbi:hypothetical protein [Methylobacterium sp. E-041]|nr:hypothetical protein [Methylobacterium sp. E-041]